MSKDKSAGEEGVPVVDTGIEPVPDARRVAEDRVINAMACDIGTPEPRLIAIITTLLRDADPCYDAAIAHMQQVIAQLRSLRP